MKPAEFLQAHGNEIVRYERMRTAIVECVSIDEVKDIRDKAHAIEVYAAQAQNLEMEEQAIRIRLRAERRCAEVMKEMREAGTLRSEKDGRSKVSDDTIPKPKTLKDLGISPQQSSDWQKLAEVPEEQFEAKLNDPTVRPSTSELIKKEPAVTKPIPGDVIWVWGRLRDFEREKCFERDAQEVYDAMTETMQDDVERILPQLIPWLTALSRRHSDEGEGKFLFNQPAA